MISQVIAFLVILMNDHHRRQYMEPSLNSATHILKKTLSDGPEHNHQISYNFIIILTDRLKNILATALSSIFTTG